MKMVETKVKIEKELLDKAKEYDIDIDVFLNTKLRWRVNDISTRIAQEKVFNEYLKYEQEQNIIKLIQRISRKSKFNYASRDSIIAEAESQCMETKDMEITLVRLVNDRRIYQPTKSNYRVTKVKP